MIVIGFHGFGATPLTSRFCTTLNEHYSAKGIKVVCPKYNYLTRNPFKDFAMLDDIIASSINADELVYLYGLSLGGFIARHFALKYHLPMVLFNPTVMPWKDVNTYTQRLPFFRGLIINSFYLERIRTSAAACRPFYSDKHHENQTVVLSQDDDILDWNFSYDYFNGKADLILHEIGGHTFEKSDKLLNSTLEHIDENLYHDNQEESYKEKGH